MGFLSESKPCIGVTGPDRGGFMAWVFSWLAIKRAGGRAFRLTPNNGMVKKELQGLVVGGGADLDPGLYGAEKMHAVVSETRKERSLLRKAFVLVFFPLLFLIRKLFSTKKQLAKIDRKRDAFELALLKIFCEQKKPILGICRGAQLVNIYLGGTLYQDLSEFYREIPNVNSVLPRKEIIVEQDSRLGAILGETNLRVNALHHQAIRELGDGLKSVAREENGVVQAVEHQGHPFLIGVQWHPEYLPHIHAQRHLFQALVKASRSSDDQRSYDSNGC